MKPLDSEQQRAVLDGAMRLFETHALNDITLDTLSRASGVAAFNIIRHYHSSDNILQAVLERELELMAGAAQPPSRPRAREPYSMRTARSTYARRNPRR